MNIIDGEKSKKRILVIALLRIGDNIALSPALDCLKKKYNDSEIDIIINENFKSMSDMLPFINSVHTFPRKELQHLISNPDSSFFESIDVLTKFIDTINLKGEYDVIYNFTHNKLSACVTGLVQSRAIIGMSTDLRGNYKIKDPWMNYLNETPEMDNGSIFHYSDIYASSVLETKSKSFNLVESKTARDRAFDLIDHKEYVVFQPLSSDKKKNVNISVAANFLKNYSKSTDSLTVYLLGAPFEQEALQKLVECSGAHKGCVKIIICDLQEAFSIIKKASLVISVDTSIKHMACAAGVKVIELSLGSSCVEKTGAYSMGSIILRPTVECFPCDHRLECTQLEYLCQQQIGTDLILRVTQSVLINTEPLTKIAEDFFGKSEIIVAERSRVGFWYARPVEPTMNYKHILNFIKKYAIQFYLNGYSEVVVPPYMSWTQDLSLDLNHIVTKKCENKIRDLLLREQEGTLSEHSIVEKIYYKFIELLLTHHYRRSDEALQIR